MARLRDQQTILGWFKLFFSCFVQAELACIFILCMSVVFYTLSRACIVIANPTRLFAKQHTPERCSKVLCLKRNKAQLSKG